MGLYLYAHHQVKCQIASSHLLGYGNSKLHNGWKSVIASSNPLVAEIGQRLWPLVVTNKAEELREVTMMKEKLSSLLADLFGFLAWFFIVLVATWLELLVIALLL
ncbi:unnamed protein product [Dovyalis caffra]|uniref:Uncharacterized protein n=1 Tax=Dovyalis caffra TaxID=77055 RepID=A0AAV1RM61_9ROSI|nr:unnamed protein product [Dovyalis caffra]